MNFPDHLKLVNFILYAVKSKSPTRDQAAIMLRRVQNFLIDLKDMIEKARIPKAKAFETLNGLFNARNPIYSVSHPKMYSVSSSYGMTWDNFVRNGPKQIMDAVYGCLPPEERNPSYATVAADGGVPYLQYDPDGKTKYVEMLNVDARISGFNFFYTEARVSVNLIYAALGARLRSAMAENRPFFASFYNPSDAFAASFLEALRRLYRSAAAMFARYVGGLAVNGIRVDLNYVSGDESAELYWRAFKRGTAPAQSAAAALANEKSA
jgi:hypothetical protein